MTSYFLTIPSTSSLGAAQVSATTIGVLQHRLDALDELASRQAGGLAVIPAAVGSIAAAEYHDITYVAWPRADYNLINMEWQKVAAFSSKSPFGTNAEVAELMTNWLDAYVIMAMARLKLAVTVDQARIAIRNLLRALPAPTPAPTPVPPTPGPTPQPTPDPAPVINLPAGPAIVFPKKASSTWLWWVVGGTSAAAIATIAVVLLKGKKKPSTPIAGADSREALRSKVGTVAHNRAFTRRDLLEYGGSEGDFAWLKRQGYIKKVEGGWYPTGEGWAWIEG